MSPPPKIVREPFAIAGTQVRAGKRQRIELPVARLPTGTPLALPITVVHGSAEGPVCWLSAAIHGDELNGVEIIRCVLEKVSSKTINGTILAIPIVNVFGFIEQTRYLPDRRDLNRMFPGSPRGSLGSRLAALFMREVVSRSQFGIDLHTASHNRTNLPQVRANLDDAETSRLAEAFGALVTLHAGERDGSLRQAAARKGIPTLLYEAGEAQRFNEEAIEAGVAGVLRVLHALEMTSVDVPAPAGPLLRARGSHWARASTSGILHLSVALGDPVEEGQPLGRIRDAFGEGRAVMRARRAGRIIGMTNNPLVHRGEAVLHIAHT